MHVLGVAENLHDSCVASILDGDVQVHLELERLTRSKRDTFRAPEEFGALLSWLLRRYRLPPPDVVAFVRHTTEPLTPALVEEVRKRYPAVQVADYEHLDCHAALALAAGLPDATVIAIDGGGDRRIDWGSPNAVHATVHDGRPVAGGVFDPAALPIDGRAWGVLSYALFGDIHAAGKVMGMAAYGLDPEPVRAQVDAFIEATLDWRYDREGLRRLCDRLPTGDFIANATLARALQERFTGRLLDAVAGLGPAHPALVLTGGCALNVTANAALAGRPEIGAVWVPPCPGDEGIALGAALRACADLGIPLGHVAFPYLGIGESGHPDDAQYRRAAELLASGGVLVTAVDRSEVGPRALGNRSILATASIENRKRVSETIKGRESFRPVAPAIRDRDVDDWLVDAAPSPYMSFAAEATALARSAAPGIVHEDGSARHQTVGEHVHPNLWRLLTELETLGVAPVLINTSLNRAGEPIVGDEADALRLALATGVDGLLTNRGFVDFRP